MHELSLALDLVEQAIAVAVKESAAKIVRIKIKIGDISGVDKEAFRFAFPEAARGTILDGAILEIEEAEGRDFQFLSMEVPSSGGIQNV